MNLIQIKRKKERKLKQTKPVIRMNDEVLGEASDSIEKSFATELAPSWVESQLILYQIESAPSRRFQPVPQVLHLVFSLIGRRRRRQRQRPRMRKWSRRRRRLLPFLSLFRRRRLHILALRHFQKKKKRKETPKKLLLLFIIIMKRGQFGFWRTVSISERIYDVVLCVCIYACDEGDAVEEGHKCWKWKLIGHGRL